MPSKNTLDAASAQLLSFSQLAQRWRCPYGNVQSRLRKAGVPIVALGPGKLRVRLSVILELEKAHA